MPVGSMKNTSALFIFGERPGGFRYVLSSVYFEYEHWKWSIWMPANETVLRQVTVNRAASQGLQGLTWALIHMPDKIASAS